MNSTEMTSEQKLFGSIQHHTLVATIVISVLVGGMIVLTALIRISGAVVATGRVVVETNTKQVQHQEGGIVKEIKVENGDLVSTGDLLIVLDDTLIRSEWEATTKQLDELYAKKARLFAEKEGAEAIDFSEYTSNCHFTALIETIKDNQQQLFVARRNSLAGQKTQLKEQVSQLKEKIAGLKAESGAKKTELEIVNRDLEDLTSLYEKKYAAKIEVTTLERDKAKLSGAYSSLIAEIAQDKEAISERHTKILQLEEDLQAEILQQIQDTRVNIIHLEAQKVVFEDQLERLHIRAPRSGYVHDLAVHTIGGVVTAGETVTSLVPKKDLLLVEAQIRPIDIDQLSSNQEARVRLPNFNQKTTPELMATLKTISADLLQDPISGAMYYQARFTISESELGKLNGKALIPGMPVEVFTKTEDRTVLSYLTKPVRDQIVYALRER